MRVNENPMAAVARAPRAAAATKPAAPDTQQRAPPVGTVATTLALSREAVEQSAKPETSPPEPKSGAASMADALRKSALTEAMRSYKVRNDNTPGQTLDVAL